MYQCKALPITGHTDKVIRAKGRVFLKKWQSEHPGPPPHVWVRCFKGGRRKIYLHEIGPHIEDHTGDLDRARRYSLLPCVKELLEKTKEQPAPMPNGMLALTGVTPIPEAKTFWVFIRIEENGRYVLRTAYPAK